MKDSNNTITLCRQRVRIGYLGQWKHHGVRRTLLLGLVALLPLLLTLASFPAPPRVALAHPLDQYLLYSYITVSPTQIVVELDMSPGVLIAPGLLPGIDANGDQQISDAEGQAYVSIVLPNFVLQVDGKPLSLTLTKVYMPDYLTTQAGYGTIRVFTVATLAGGMTGTHTIYFMNNFAPKGAAYQVNAFVDKSVPITLGKQNRDSIYQSLTVDYTIGSANQASTTTAVPATTNSAPSGAAPAAGTTTGQGTAGFDTGAGTLAGSSGQVRQLLGYLYAPTLSPWLLLLAVGLAGLLGALHALTPGHGKTLVAAYLVGSRGTVRHAVALGSIVTFTHTSSVIVIGLLALFASQFIVPNVLVPILEIISGLLVVFMGARLVLQRWAAYRVSRTPNYAPAHDHHDAHNQGHDHYQDHDHTQGNDHGQINKHEGEHAHAYTHDHGDGHVHSHLPPAEGIKLNNLLAMGISGGLLPCPEALGLMVIAIGLNRILLGLGLIVSFSFGLAAVLIILGVMLVRSRSLVERFGRSGSHLSRLSSILPLASAAIVTVLGLGITLSGLAIYLGNR